MAAKTDINRREAIGLGVMGGLALGLTAPVRTAKAAAKPPAGAQRPKNIIYMVSDGMSNGVPSLAEPFSQQVRDRGTRWYGLLADPRATNGFFETYSLNSLVTDSAAASSAWASGSRVCNGALNVLPDGTELTPIARLVRDTGRRIGLVTTTQMTHATPAGFAAVQPSRDDHAQIAPQYLDVVDVLMGGGIEYFDKDLRGDGVDLIARYRQAGYAFWDQRPQVTGDETPEKALGLFYQKHLPYTLDWKNQPELSAKVPSLAEMTQKALRILDRHGDGFLLQVEGGRVDHAAHANDAAGILWDQLAFDDALAVALEFIADRDDTLLIVTSDHGNANPGLNGMGTRYEDSSDCFERIAGATASVEHMAAKFARLNQDGAAAVDDVIGLIKEGGAIELTKDEGAAVLAALKGAKPDEISHQHDNAVGMLGQALGNHNGVGWTGVTHTSDLVWLTALGPGSGEFKGVVKNTESFVKLMKLIGVAHRNPSMTPDQARQIQAQAAARPTAVSFA